MKYCETPNKYKGTTIKKWHLKESNEYNIEYMIRYIRRYFKW